MLMRLSESLTFEGIYCFLTLDAIYIIMHRSFKFLHIQIHELCIKS